MRKLMPCKISEIADSVQALANCRNDYRYPYVLKPILELILNDLVFP